MACHKFQQQIHSGPMTLKITQIIQSLYLNIFQVQFWYKSLFLLFFSLWIERKEKGYQIMVIEREKYHRH
jgi:hypothetical protein